MLLGQQLDLGNQADRQVLQQELQTLRSPEENRTGHHPICRRSRTVRRLERPLGHGTNEAEEALTQVTEGDTTIGTKVPVTCVGPQSCLTQFAHPRVTLETAKDELVRCNLRLVVNANITPAEVSPCSISSRRATSG